MCDHHRMPRRHFLGLIPGMALAVSGCSQQTTGPVEIKWGRDTCDYCGMVIDDHRFAAQLRGGKDRKVYKFDDLGDAVLFLVKQDWADDPATEFWVGGLEIAKGQWLDGLKAYYLGNQRSPMAHGFGAIAGQRDGAVDFVRMKGMVVVRGSTSRCEPTGNADVAMETRG